MYPHWKSSFALLWVGQAFSILTSMVSQFVLTLHLAQSTGSTAALSLATLFIVLPQGVLSLFTGSFADRFDRRYIMAISDGTIGIVSLFLAIAAARNGLTPGLIYLALTLRSIGGAFHAPCIQATAPLIVPQEALAKCAGWSQGIQTVSMLISPALAAILLRKLPLHFIIGLDTLGAGLAVLFLLLARLPSLKVGSGGKLRLFQDSWDGFAVLRSHAWLWQLCLVCALFSIAFMPINALFPLMSLTYFGGTADAVAVVETAFSVGMLAGSILLGVWGGTKNKIVTMAGAIFVLGTMLVGISLLSPTAFVAFVVLSFLGAFSAPFFNSLFMVLIQQRVEGEYLGRVMGISGAIMSLASPIGLAVTALWGDLLPLPTWFFLSGLVVLVCGVLCIVLPAIRTCDLPNP